MLAVQVGLCFVATGVACHPPKHKLLQRNEEQHWNRVQAEFKLRLAKEQSEQGFVREATRILEEAVTLDPENPAYHRLLARCYTDASAFGAARRTLRHAASLGDTSPMLAYTQGMLAEQQADHEEALRYYSEAAELEPTSVNYHLAMAESLVNLDRAADAKILLDEQLRSHEGDKQLALLRAHVHVLLNDLAAAAADFETAEVLLRNAPWAAEEFGLVLVRLGRYAKGLSILRPHVESASESLGEAPSALPVSRAAVLALAACYNRVRSPEKAKRLMEDHLRHSPEDGRAWWLLAESLIQVGDWEGAQRCIQHGMQERPQVTDWGLLQAYIAWRQNDLETCATLLESVVAEDPADSLARQFLAQVHETRSKLDPARQSPPG